MPLAGSFLADLILLSVICRLRPSWRAMTSPGRVRQLPLHLGQARYDVDEEETTR